MNLGVCSNFPILWLLKQEETGQEPGSSVLKQRFLGDRDDRFSI